MTIQDEKAKSKNITLRQTLVGFEDDNFNVSTDKMRIQQVVLSYQSNALKFTPKDGLIEIISTKVQRNQESFLEVSVRDNGCGITEANQQKLFRLFGYLDDTSDMNSQGVGLGLYITKMIVQAFDGSVSVKSKMGEGSDFGLTFKLSDEVQAAQGVVRELNPTSFWGQQKISLVPRMSSFRPFISSKIKLKRKRIPAAKESQVVLLKEENFVSSESSFCSIDDSRVMPRAPHDQQRIPQALRSLKPILLVDDEPFNLLSIKTVISSVLKKKKLQASAIEMLLDQAHDGTEAVAMVQDSNCFYKLIISDC